MSTTQNLQHEEWCGPPPGEDEPRTERYRHPLYDDKGLRQIGSVEVHRCLECASTLYDGERRG